MNYAKVGRMKFGNFQSGEEEDIGMESMEAKFIGYNFWDHLTCACLSCVTNAGRQPHPSDSAVAHTGNLCCKGAHH